MCNQMSDGQHKIQKMSKEWTSHHINHNEVINADGSCRARLAGRVAMVTVGGSEGGSLVSVWALTKNKLLLLWLKCPNIKWKSWKGVGTNGLFKHRTRQEYCTGYDIVSNISPTVEIQFHSSWTISNKHGGSKSTTLQWYCIKRWHGALKERRWVKGRLRAAGNPYLDQSPYPEH